MHQRLLVTTPTQSGGQLATIGDWRSKEPRFGASAPVSGPHICETAAEKAQNGRVLGRSHRVEFIRAKNGARGRSDRDVLALKFPAFRELNREIPNSRALRTSAAAKSSAFSVPYREIPCDSEQGIKWPHQGDR